MLRTRFAKFLISNRWLLNLVFIALGSYFVAGAVNAVMARQLRVLPSVGDVSVSKSDRPRRVQQKKQPFSYSMLATRNLMGSKRENLSPVDESATRFDEAKAAEGEDFNAAEIGGTDFKEEDLKDCSLPIALRATLVSTPKDWSIAMIYNNSTRETQVYNIKANHNEITSDAVLVDIRPNEIVVRRTDHFELCKSNLKGPRSRSSRRPSKGSLVPSKPHVAQEAGRGVERLSETEYEIERAEVDRVLSNLSEVSTKARIVPSFKNGKPNGFKLFSIKPGSIFANIGLKNGDVVQRINGYEMNSPDKALEVYQKLKASSSISVDVIRRGRSMNMQYNIGR